MNLGGGVIKLNKCAIILLTFLVVFIIYVFTSNSSIEAFPKRQQNKVSFIDIFMIAAKDRRTFLIGQL